MNQVISIVRDKRKSRKARTPIDDDLKSERCQTRTALAYGTWKRQTCSSKLGAAEAPRSWRQ